jgi:hypothetical protein
MQGFGFPTLTMISLDARRIWARMKSISLHRTMDRGRNYLFQRKKREIAIQPLLLLKTLIDSPAYFFHGFIVLLLYFPQSFEHFVRRSGKVKDPFAYCVVYGGRRDCGEAGTNVFADAIRTIC